jgi:ADP-ribosylglycohydrolase
LRLDRRDYRDRVAACWLGKSIGGTLGGPWECRRHTHALTFYEPIPDGSAPNDDLDLQLVWLRMLEQQGVDPSVRTFADYWDRYASAYPWNEYGFFMRNFTRGLRPPVAGCFENYFVDEMGSPIRSEIWACLHPGDPQSAARMAWKDSAVDHAGGEGTCGEMFWAALESAAFVERDPMTLIRIGLAMIPLSSHLARAIREAVWCHRNGLTWGEARERIVKRFATVQPCAAAPNHAFTVIGWLYGEDFGDRLCKAVNCGYDTDCTGATLGSVLGILDGTAGIPAKWRRPVGERIVLHRFTGDCDAPTTLDELTDRTVALAEKAAAAKTDVAFGDRTELPEDLRSRLFCSDLATAALAQDNHAGVELLPDGREIWLHYGGEPVLRPGIAREVRLTVGADAPAKCTLGVPGGWTCESTGEGRFRVFSPGPVADRNALVVALGGEAVTFTMLGPGEAQGVAAGDNVETCPRCRARIEACICGERPERGSAT